MFTAEKQYVAASNKQAAAKTATQYYITSKQA
jgi:hypothetical protein